MTLNDFVTKYDGKKIGDGECGTLVRQYAIEVQGITPVSYTSAKDYWFNPVPGYVQASTPQSGDWAVYNGHGTFVDGHMAVYVGPGVFEQNADPDGSPAHLFTRANTYLLGYLRLQGETMTPTAQQAHDTVMAFETEADGITPHQPTQADLDFGVSTPWPAYIPNFYPMVQVLRDKIKLLTDDRNDNLYHFINEVTAALGLPPDATAEECVAAIKSGSDSAILKQIKALLGVK